MAVKYIRDNVGYKGLWWDCKRACVLNLLIEVQDLNLLDTAKAIANKKEYFF